MSAVRMDGKALSAKVRGSILAETEGAERSRALRPAWRLSSWATTRPARFTSAIRSAPASECGFYSEKYALPEETTQEELLGLIAQLNESPADFGHPVPDAGAEAYLRAGGHRRHRSEKGRGRVPSG